MNHKSITRAAVVLTAAAALTGITASVPAQASAAPHTVRTTDQAGMTITVPDGQAAQNVILIARPADSTHVPQWHQAFIWTRHGRHGWTAEYAPKGKPSGFCMGQIQFAGWAQLRHCRAGSRWQLWHRQGMTWRNREDSSILSAATYSGGEIYNHASLVGPPTTAQKWSAS